MKCHDYEAQPSWGTQRRRYEKQTMWKKATYETTDARKKIEEPPLNGR